MKKFFIMAVFFCLLAGIGQMSAQFTVHRFGNADLGDQTFDPENNTLPQ